MAAATGPAGPISPTAEAAAFGRAIESLRRGPDRLVNDPFARLFLGRRRRWLLTAMRVPSFAAALLSVHEHRLPGVLGNLLCRTRFIDDALVESIEGGIEQVVILGAGYDTRAYRIAALRRLPVFEVDRPPVFSIKRPLLDSALGAFPSNVSLVGLDLDRESLGGALAAANFDARLPTFFIWEGVTQYLTHDAIDAVFSFVAGTAAGSRIVFSYVDQAVIEAPETPAAAAIIGWVERLGEPWISGFAPDQIGGYLAARRLAIDAHVGAAEYRRRYLEPAGRVLRLYDNEHLVTARVTK